jgi:hypothetical protein
MVLIPYFKAQKLKNKEFTANSNYYFDYALSIDTLHIRLSSGFRD